MRAAPLEDHWSPTLPPEDRKRYRVAWQEFKSCRDCTHWHGEDPDEPGIAACDTEKYAALLTPEDYTCEKFAPATVAEK